jgi:hypothetical protein
MTASDWQEVVVNSIHPFLSHLGMIHDPRRARVSSINCTIFCCFHSGDCDGRQLVPSIGTFTKTNLKRLNKAFKIDWKRPPVHTAIRYILQGLDPADIETVFREHALKVHFRALNSPA